MKDLFLKILKNNKEKEEWSEILSNLLPKFNINSKLEVCHFMAQACHESLDFTLMQEGLSYSDLDRLKVIYGNRIRKALNKSILTDIEYSKYIKNSEGLSQLLFAGFHGRGIFQLTHKENYLECSKDLSLQEIYTNPSCVAKNKEIAIKTACWFWNKNKLSLLANQDKNEVYDIEIKDKQGEIVKVYKDINVICAKISKIINGGFHGIEDRNNRLKLYVC